MTLLLGALTKDAVVLAADGLEFRHAPGRPKWEDLSNRQKVFPLLDRPAAIGVHGQNRLTKVGADLESQELAIDMLLAFSKEIGATETVFQICSVLFEQFTPHVVHTFANLANAGINAAPMGILVVGFDSNRRGPKCYEAWWPLPNANETSRLIEHPQNKQIPAVIHSGDGASFAKQTIGHGGRYNVDKLKRTNVVDTQQYVRGLYAKAESLQPQQSREFGGVYHEVTVTPDGAKWTADPAATQ